jgi:hypothetical protein
MGRHINCMIGDEYESVWKYRFGVQNSEMHRITSDLGIGQYHSLGHSDTLILTRIDIEKIEEHGQTARI